MPVTLLLLLPWRDAERIRCPRSVVPHYYTIVYRFVQMIVVEFQGAEILYTFSVLAILLCTGKK
jgi:hypothetical protein